MAQTSRLHGVKCVFGYNARDESSDWSCECMAVAREGDRVLLFSQDYKTYLITLKAGARMQTHRGIIEAGTGSGGLTTALARIVQPNGQVYSYEYRVFRRSKWRS